MPDRAMPDAPQHFFPRSFPARNVPPSPSQWQAHEEPASAPVFKYSPRPAGSPPPQSHFWNREHEAPTDRGYRDTPPYSPTQRFNRVCAPVRGPPADRISRDRPAERPQSRPSGRMPSPRGMQQSPRAFTPGLGRRRPSPRAGWSSPRGYSPQRRSRSLSPGWQSHGLLTDQPVYPVLNIRGQMPWGRLPHGRSHSKQPRSRCLSPQWQSPASPPWSVAGAGLFGNPAGNRRAPYRDHSPHPRDCRRSSRVRSPGPRDFSFSPVDCSPIPRARSRHHRAYSCSPRARSRPHRSFLCSPRACSHAHRDNSPSPTHRPHAPKRRRIIICQKSPEQDENAVAAKAAAKSPDFSMLSPQAHDSAECLPSPQPVSLPHFHPGRCTPHGSSPLSSRSATSRPSASCLSRPQLVESASHQGCQSQVPSHQQSFDSSDNGSEAKLLESLQPHSPPAKRKLEIASPASHTEPLDSGNSSQENQNELFSSADLPAVLVSTPQMNRAADAAAASQKHQSQGQHSLLKKVLTKNSTSPNGSTRRSPGSDIPQASHESSQDVIDPCSAANSASQMLSATAAESNRSQPAELSKHKALQGSRRAKRSRWDDTVDVTIVDTQPQPGHQAVIPKHRSKRARHSTGD